MVAGTTSQPRIIGVLISTRVCFRIGLALDNFATSSYVYFFHTTTFGLRSTLILSLHLTT